MTPIGLEHFLYLSAVLFCLGLGGVILRPNAIVMLMCVELMLNGVNVSFLAFSYFTKHLEGQVMVFFIMTLAAAEAGVGLAIVVKLFRQFESLELNLFAGPKDLNRC